MVILRPCGPTRNLQSEPSKWDLLCGNTQSIGRFNAKVVQYQMSILHHVYVFVLHLSVDESFALVFQRNADVILDKYPRIVHITPFHVFVEVHFLCSVLAVEIVKVSVVSFLVVWTQGNRRLSYNRSLFLCPPYMWRKTSKEEEEEEEGSDAAPYIPDASEDSVPVPSSAVGDPSPHGVPGLAKSNKAMRGIAAIVNNLMRHKWAWPFNVPVDWKALQITDYPVIITHPMDLGTIKTRLDTGGYTDMNEVARDIRLVWRNAMTYNPPDNDSHIMARALSEAFEDKWRDLLDRLGIPAYEEEMGKRKRSERSSLEGDRSRDPMSEMEGRWLRYSITELSSDELQAVVGIVNENMGLHKNLDEGAELEINIDEWDTRTQRAVEKYVLTCRGHKKAKAMG
eukprot:TRINITY_DN2380_c3_g1_i2.p2 TRINITY_DN2380_c3_g1~~TRINITY_DN2380_c3_g1_i2.p2  ORF type:complete len:397 (+),score=74.82 TRINITY_DN2380_c3_g1_i2:110-1300(+)